MIDPNKRGSLFPAFDLELQSTLIRSLSITDPAAWRRIELEYSASLRATAMGMLNDVVEAEDAVEEALIIVCAGFKGFRADTTLYAWINSTVKHICRERLDARTKLFGLKSILSSEQTK